MANKNTMNKRRLEAKERGRCCMERREAEKAAKRMKEREQQAAKDAA